MTDLFDLLFKISGLLFGLLLQRVDLSVGLVPVFIGIVGLLNDICHLLSFLMQLTLQLFVEIVKDDSFLSQTIDHKFKLLVDCDGLVELLVGLVESILQNFDLFLKVVQILSPRIDAVAVLLLFDDLLLEVGDVDINILLGFLFLLNGVGNLM